MKAMSGRSGGYDTIVDTRNNEVDNHQPKPIINEIVPVQQPVNSSTFSTAAAAPSQGSRTGFFLKYDLKEEIGVGSTSKCFRCVRKSDGMTFACKVIDKKHVEVKFSGLLDQFFTEIKILQTLNHPNIIRLEDTYETSERIYMVMEMMVGGELFDYVVEKGTLSEEEASTIVRKVTSAVAHMHSLDIIHRDLKPENLLLTSKRPDAEVKLIDFGLAKETEADNMARSFLGTRGYLAPEVVGCSSPYYVYLLCYVHSPFYYMYLLSYQLSVIYLLVIYSYVDDLLFPLFSTCLSACRSVSMSISSHPSTSILPLY